MPTATRTWFILLAVVGVLNAAISAGYYLRLIAAMYFRPALSRPAGQGSFGSYLCLVFCSVLLVAIGLMPQSLFDSMRPTGPALREAKPDIIRTISSATEPR
jgi:NADH-quinone oxidoreductase subunit N